jgi:hypothetical protein
MMAKSGTKSKAPAKAAAARDQDEALTQRRPAAAEDSNKHSEDLGMDTVHQRVLSNEEVAENAARERGAPAAGLDRDESPKVTGFRLVPDDRVVMVDDEVILVTPNPIEGQTENKAIVTKVNPNSTINVKVEIGGPTGTLRQFSSVRNEITQDRSPWWRWPEES